MSAAGVWLWTLAFAIVAALVAKWLVFPAIGRTAAVRQPLAARLLVSLVAGFYVFAVLHAGWRASFWLAAIEREDPATLPWGTVKAVGFTLVLALLFLVPLALLVCAACIKPHDARACVAMLAIVALELATGVGVFFALVMSSSVPMV